MFARALCLLIGCITLAAYAQPNAQRDFEARQRAIENRFGELRALKAGTAPAYLPAARELVAQFEALVREFPDEPRARQGLASDIVKRKLELANYARFRLRQPQLALELYREAVRLVESSSLEPGAGAYVRMGIADTFQFDLGDRKRALAEYRGLLDRMRAAAMPTNPTEANLVVWVTRWLSHQVAWLQDGRRFSGALDVDDLGVGTVLYAFGGGEDGEERFGIRPGPQPRTAEDLGRYLPSNFSLLQIASDAVGMQDGAAAIRLLERHDPAGYFTAALMAAVLRSNTSTPFAQAARPYLESRKIRLAGTAINPRLSSPKATWELFIGSLRAGDLATAMSCMSREMQAKVKPMFAAMSAKELRATADSFTKFELGRGDDEMYEAFVVRSNGKAGVISFEKFGAEWKIDDM